MILEFMFHDAQVVKGRARRSQSFDVRFPKLLEACRQKLDVVIREETIVEVPGKGGRQKKHGQRTSAILDDRRMVTR